MSETQKVDKTKRKFTKKPPSEVDDFKVWLTTLGLISAPKCHVNGRDFPMAVLAVDFGTPLDEPTKITSDQSAELVTKMKTITKSFFKADVNVRVQNDSNNGVWWTSIN